MKIILSIAFVFVFVSIYGQDKNAKPPVVFKEKIIKMPKYSIGDFPKKSPTISGIKVIQFVKDSVKLGYVFKGPDNQIANLISAKPLSQLIQDDIDKMYNDNYKKNGDELLFVLKDLRIAERTSFFEYSYLRFNGEAYLKNAENKYSFITSIDSVFITQSSGDVTAWHGVEIENAFKLLLKQSLGQIVETKKGNHQPVSLKHIEDSSMHNFNFPIITQEILIDGAYADFNEFLQNKPSISEFETIVQNKSQIYFTKKNKNKTDTLNVWGVCKAGQVFKYYNSKLIAIEKEGNSFLIADYAQKANKRNSQIFVGSVLGGLAGALIATSNKNTAPILTMNISHISNKQKQPEATLIDMKNGEFSF